ncbi:unnamed protein product [Eretmochelys imbricata]
MLVICLWRMGEDREWLLKVKFVQTHKVTQRLEAKVIEIHLYDTSFYNLKPRSWLGVEVIQAISSVTSTSILSGRAKLKLEKKNSGIMQSDLLLLPFNAPKHWVLVITLMETKEVLIIDPLGDETRYERTFLRTWSLQKRFYSIKTSVL